MNSRARFRHMQDGSAEDWAIIAQRLVPHPH